LFWGGANREEVIKNLPFFKTLLSCKIFIHKAKQKCPIKKQLSQSDHDSDEAEDEYAEPVIAPKKEKLAGRTSVSAEVYGKFNKKEAFKPKVVPKSNEQKNKIALRLNQAFMFSALDEKEKEILINAMEERKVRYANKYKKKKKQSISNKFIFSAGNWVIKQGEDGDNLYVVESGKLKCFRKSGKEEKYLKTYQPGESFGELALLYNAPRAASIQAETDAVLFALDRESFNHIVKDAAVKKRERYEEFLLKVKKILKYFSTKNL
jgi:cAMP-dependent protein kinase regulator